MCVNGVLRQGLQEVFGCLGTCMGWCVLELMTVDIAVYLNCPSIEGYRYVLTFINAATSISGHIYILQIVRSHLC